MRWLVQILPFTKWKTALKTFLEKYTPHKLPAAQSLRQKFMPLLYEKNI